VKVKFLIGAREGKAGETVDVPDARGKQLVRGGIARPANKTAAKVVEEPKPTK